MGTKSKWKKGRLTFYNDAVVDGTVEEFSAIPTTSFVAMAGYGLSVIGCTAASLFTLGAPVAGVTKDIVVGDGKGSSFTATIRCSTVANQIRIANPTTDMNGVVLTPGSTIPAYVQLRGVSTVLWVLTSFTTGKGGASLTTACT